MNSADLFNYLKIAIPSNYCIKVLPCDKLVVVKGPYTDLETINKFKENMKIKQDLNLPIIPYKIVELIPDRWPDGIPLGTRNKLDRNKLATFIVFDSVITRDKVKTKKHSSKVWPETEVVDWENMEKFHFNYKYILSFNQVTDYIKAILFRYVFGISDLADRNFIVLDDRVISIDEDISGNWVNLYGELKKNKAQWVYNKIEEHYDILGINTWATSITLNGKQQWLYNEINNKDKCLELFRAN